MTAKKNAQYIQLTETKSLKKRNFPFGVSLIEALVCLVVLALSILALVGLHTTLRYNAEVARQRAEAARIASRELESARDILSVDGNTQSWNLLLDRTIESVQLPNNLQNTTYRLQRTVTTSTAIDGSPRKLVDVLVSWADRAATAPAAQETQQRNQSLRIQALIAGVDPRLGGQLAVPQIRPASSLRNGRHASIPASARDMGDGSSAFKPFDHGETVWIFNNTTAHITSVCTGVTSAQNAVTTSDLSTCQTVNGRMVSGTVHSTESDNPGVAEAATPSGPGIRALSASEPLTFTAAEPANHAQASCVSNSITSESELVGLQFSNVTYQPVKYYCLVVMTANTPGWGGQFQLVPGTLLGLSTPDWSVGTAGASHKVCRYTRFADPNPDFVGNFDHPRTYCRTSYVANSTSCTNRVTQSLTEQNYLLIKATANCPSDTRSVDIASGVLATYNTRQHQPAPQ